jgi:hypothetical protein
MVDRNRTDGAVCVLSRHHQPTKVSICSHAGLFLCWIWNGNILIFMLTNILQGLAFAGTYLRFTSVIITFMVCMAFVLASFVLFTAHFPVGSSYTLSLTLYAAFIVTLPFTFVALSFDTDTTDMLRTAIIALLGLYTALNVFMAVVIKFKLSGRPLIAGKRRVITEGEGKIF